MTIIVTGGRAYRDAAVMDAVLRTVRPHRVVHGDYHGADQLAKAWAIAHNIDQQPYPADWTTYGGAAGPRRNAQMLREEAVDLVVAFPGGRGTADMVTKARSAGVPVVDWNDVIDGIWIPPL